MDPRLLHYYERELEFIREMGREFARAYPKVGARLDLDSFECADPYVERLLEGFAFLTARVQLKLDAEFPRFTQHLLELVYPGYLAPIPSMAVVQFSPDPDGGVPAEGYVLERGTRLFASASDPQRTRVEMRTGMELDLRPLRISQARYVPPGGLELTGVDYRAALRVELATVGEIPSCALEGLDRLVIFLAGGGRVPWELYEWIHAHTCGVLIHAGATLHRLPSAVVSRPGFDPEEALLPVEDRSFDGYRLLQEYFAFPERYRFFSLNGLAPALKAAGQHTAFSIILLFDRENPNLDGQVEARHLTLHCTPAVNLFPRRCDRIHLDPTRSEYHLVVDRSRPLGYEIHSVLSVEGYAEGARPLCTVHPFYRLEHRSSAEHMLYYTVQRLPRVGHESAAHYVPHEVYLSLVDPDRAPVRPELHQLGVRALCTNRDLCQRLRLGDRLTDFHLDIGAPVTSVRALAGPSNPVATPTEGEHAWRLISQLNLNYHTLASTQTLRQLLEVHARAAASTYRRRIKGLRAVEGRSTVRRLPGPGPAAFARGSAVTLRFDRQHFEGETPFLLGSILAVFLGQYTWINSFVETRIEDENGEEIATVCPLPGARATV